MKHLNRFIIASLVLLTIPLAKPTAYAEYCGSNDTHYKGVYCGLKQHGNENADDEIIEAVAAQFGFDESMVKGVLSNTICDTLDDLPLEDAEKIPERISTACSSKGNSTASLSNKWDLFSDVQSAYNKEKVLQNNSKSLRFKFKASEQYWDGSLADGAPFDLIVDLNLIDIVLFGSRAEWYSNVFSFPTKEDDDSNQTDDPLEFDEDGSDDPDPGSGDGSGGADPSPGNNEGEGEIPDCVDPNHPDAEASPGPDNADNLLCGNGILDPLLAEQCDDGNSDSGDGCNQYCQIETSGSDNICIDREAVTFKSPDDSGSNGGGDNNDNNGTQCPAGTVPSKTSRSVRPSVKDVPQALTYPGPHIGGTLKQFPASNRPACGPGETELKAELLGNVLKGDEAICMPTEFCTDPDDVRTFLAATAFPFPINGIAAANWKDLDEKHAVRQSLEAIEATFCVNIIKDNRPLSPYAINEGCVDCHLAAMADALEEALSGNVTPLVNSTSAFGISSAFAPNSSFNLNTAVISKTKYQRSSTAGKRIGETDKVESESNEAAKFNNPITYINLSESPLAELERNDGENTIEKEKISDDTKNYQRSSDTIPDLEVNSRISPLLEQMKTSFGNIQGMYSQMVGHTKYQEVPICRP